MTKYPDNEEMVEELLDLEAGLSGWELDFIENMGELTDDDTPLTDRQEDKLKELWRRHCE